VLPLRVEEVAQNERDVALVEILCRLQAERERRIMCPVAGKRLELDEQRWHEVEGHPDLR